MKSLQLIALLFVVLLAGCSTAPLNQDSQSGNVPDSTQHLLITVSQSTGLAQAQLGDPGAFYLRRRGYGPNPGVNRTLDQIAEAYDLRRVDGWLIASINQYCEVFEIAADRPVADLVEQISTDPRVEIAQPMNYFETQGVHYDDPLATLQPALSTLGIDSAHEIATGRGVTVAVIDSTVDAKHSEFRGRMKSQVNLVDRNGSVRAEVHGTAVAGVIGSAANNGEGIVGVAPESTIASLRACWTVDAVTGRAQCSSFSLAQALETAIRMRADVVNLSLSGPEDPLLTELIEAAVDAGIVIVSALPSRVQTNAQFPASHHAVIAVASSDAPVEAVAANVLRAPGAEVMTTMPNDGYAVFSGNSMSAAYVTGVSALMRERVPDISPADVLTAMSESVTETTVNACRAIAVAEASTMSC